MKLPPPPSTGLFFGDISSSLFHAGASHIFKGVLLNNYHFILLLVDLAIIISSTETLQTFI